MKRCVEGRSDILSHRVEVKDEDVLCASGILNKVGGRFVEADIL